MKKNNPNKPVIHSTLEKLSHNHSITILNCASLKEPKINVIDDSDDDLIYVKTEPQESLCRCCFKTLRRSDQQYPIDEELRSVFLGLTQLFLMPCTQAPNVCEDCHEEIHKFSMFKRLSMERQEKFEKIFSVKGDLSEIYKNRPSPKASTLPMEIEETQPEPPKVIPKPRITLTSKLTVASVRALPKQSFMPRPDYAVKSSPSIPAIKKCPTLPNATAVNGRKHECEQCGRKYLRARGLKRHLLAHEGLKYTCLVPNCFASVNRKDNMLYHIKTAHKDLSQELQMDYNKKCIDMEYEARANIERRLRKKIQNK